MAQQYNNYNQSYGGMNQPGYDIYGRGYNVNTNIPRPKLGNTLTEEQIAKLRNTGEVFSLQLTEEERLKGICLHRNNDGSTAIIENPIDGSCTCTICHHTFTTGEYSDEEVRSATDMILNILQTCKLMYLDMPTQAAAEYYQIIPLIEKIPKLFKTAADNFRRHDNVSGILPGQPMSPFTIFGALSNPAYGFGYQQPQPQNPYMNQQYGFNPQQPPMQAMNMPVGSAPMYQTPGPAVADPNFNNGYNNGPMSGYTNQFGYPGAGDQQGYRPNNPGFAYNPAAAQGTPVVNPQPNNGAPANNNQPAQPNAQTNGKDVQVNASLKV